MTGHIFIYGEIGRGMGQVSVRNVQAQIEPNKSDYILHLISPGGDVFEGFGIYNLLKNTGKKITTHIEGVTASIATLIAFAGERLEINKTAEFMIHNPYITDLKGDSKDLMNTANQLDKIKSLLMEVSAERAARNGKPISTEELSKLYDRETWLTSSESIERGFVDDYIKSPLRAVATIDLKRIKMEKNEGWLKTAISRLFKNKSFKNEFTETLEDGTKVIVMSEDGDWTNKPIMTEAGDQLPPGEYKLSSGKVITVGDGSTITQVTEAAPVEENKKPEETTEDMTKIQELEQQLAAAKAGQAAAEAKANEVAAAQSQLTAKFENRFKELESKMTETVGEKPNLKKGPSFINLDDPAKEYDPMGEHALEILKSRNRINA